MTVVWPENCSTKVNTTQQSHTVECSAVNNPTWSRPSGKKACWIVCMFFSTSPIHSLAQWAVAYLTYAVCFLVPHPFTHWLVEQWCMCLTLYFSTSPIHSLAHWTVVYVTYTVCFLVPHLFTQWAVVYVSYAAWFLVPHPFTHWLFEQWCMCLMLYVF